MENMRFHSLFMIFISSIFFINPISGDKNLRTNQSAFFIFGDSLLDAGNNNYINTFRSAQSNFWPYGQTTFKFPTGRVSNGRLIPDFIAEYAWLPLIPPYLQPGNNQYTYGVNFASAGAGTFVETFAGLVIDFKTQLENFKNVEKNLVGKLGKEETKALFSRAVYLINVGGNDYIYPFLANSTLFQSLTRKQYVDLVIANIATAVKQIYSSGGRKFGFVNLGRVDCTPASMVMDPKAIGSCFKPMTQLIQLHNEAFPKVLKTLQTQLPGLKYALHDFYTSSGDIINNPSKYGFKEGQKACCGSGPFRGLNTCGGKLGDSQDYELCENVEDYVFFDGSHPTEKAYQLLAKMMWTGPPDVTGPYNLKTLFQI